MENINAESMTGFIWSLCECEVSDSTDVAVKMAYMRLPLPEDGTEMEGQLLPGNAATPQGPV